MKDFARRYKFNSHKWIELVLTTAVVLALVVEQIQIQVTMVTITTLEQRKDAAMDNLLQTIQILPATYAISQDILLIDVQIEISEFDSRLTNQGHFMVLLSLINDGWKKLRSIHIYDQFTSFRILHNTYTEY
mmetsp:Transcript_9330/g.10859  ORF Transcript_9330/g.10859 Transcript_9330/m.10859 type:complete len:132 (+) Transcript_9330:2590-2985(+)